MTIWQVQVTWTDPTTRHVYADILGPYTTRQDAEAAERQAQRRRPNAETEIVTQRAHV